MWLWVANPQSSFRCCWKRSVREMLRAFIGMLPRTAPTLAPLFPPPPPPPPSSAWWLLSLYIGSPGVCACCTCCGGGVRAAGAELLLIATLPDSSRTTFVILSLSPAVLGISVHTHKPYVIASSSSTVAPACFVLWEGGVGG